MRDDPADIWRGDYSSQYEAANYGSGLAGFVMRRSHELIEKSFGPNCSFGTVLEVGAGSGVHIQFVRHRFSRYVMTDFSQHMLDQTRCTVPGVEIQEEDATRLSFADASVDRLIATHVLEHLHKPHEVLREWVRVLRPGGLLSLVLPCDPGLLWRLGRHLGPRRAAIARGLSYDYVMAREHVNSITNLVAFIRYYFDEREEFWWPTRLQSTDANLIYAVNIRV
jgi:phosphatidylethanolamine/phosphatidyl-N-methylethanolamine N-methyltransferase